MSTYPYWSNRDFLKSVTHNLELNQVLTLEDGRFYGNSLNILDADGNEIKYRLQAQDADESEKAGTGVYGQATILSKPVNPCTIKYTPRFLITSEDHKFAMDTFEHVSGVDISSFTNNIDDLINAIVPPKQNVHLPLGNFNNSQRLVDSLNGLTEVIEKTYVDITDLPEAIEDIYINAKGGTEEGLLEMRKLNLKPLDANAVMADSIKVLSRPPEGAIFGNCIYIAFRDQQFNYNGPREVRRGDVVLVNKGKLEILRYGSHYYNRLETLAELDKSLSNYAARIQDGLNTVSKDIEDAIEELRGAMTGYYPDSLYFNDNITDSSLFNQVNGTMIGIVTKSFEHENIAYDYGNVLLITPERVYRIGVTPAQVNALVSTEYKLSAKRSELVKNLAPMEQLINQLATVEGVDIPNLEDGDLAVIMDSIQYNGIDLTNGSAVNSLYKRIELFKMRSGYINDAELVRLIGVVKTTWDKMRTLATRVSRTANYIQNLDNDTFVTSFHNQINISGYYFLGNPIDLGDDELSVRNLGTWDISQYTVLGIRPLIGDIYLLTENAGVIQLSQSEGVAVSPTDFKTAKSATDVIAHNRSVALITQAEGNFIIETEDSTYTFTGTLIGGDYYSSVIFYRNKDGKIVVRSLALGKELELDIEFTRTLKAENSTVLVNGEIPVGILRNGNIEEYTITSPFPDTMRIYPSIPNPTIILPEFPLGLNMVVL